MSSCSFHKPKQRLILSEAKDLSATSCSTPIHSTASQPSTQSNTPLSTNSSPPPPPFAQEGRAHRHLLQKSLHPSHHALPRLLRLLHLPQRPRPTRRPFHDPRRSPRRSRARPPRRLQRSALLARRPARANFPRSARLPSEARLHAHARLSRRDVRTRSKRNRAASSLESRRDGRDHPRASKKFQRQRRPHARNGQHASDARRFASRESSRQSSRAAPSHDGRSREIVDRVYDGNPHRHRRNARRADRFAARDSRDAREIRSHPGSHHPKFPRQARHSDGASHPSPPWTICCARSPSPA